jgi:hypothetical protein
LVGFREFKKTNGNGRKALLFSMFSKIGMFVGLKISFFGQMGLLHLMGLNLFFSDLE